MKKQPPTETIAFVSTPEELKYLLSDEKQKKLGSIHFICMMPSAEYAARTTHVCFSAQEDFYDSSEFMRNTSEEGFTHCEQMAQYIDSQLNEWFNDVCSKNFFSSITFVFYLKMFYDTIFRYVFISKSIIEKLHPTRIVCFIDKRTYHYLNLDFYIGDRLSKVLGIFQHIYDFELIVLISPTIECSITRSSNQNKNILRKKLTVLLKKIAHIEMEQDYSGESKNPSIKNILSQIIQSYIYKLNENKNLPIVCTGRSSTLAQLNEYTRGWKEIGGEIQSIVSSMDKYDDFNIDYDKNSFLKIFNMSHEHINSFWDELQKQKNFLSFFEYENINFFEAIKPWFELYIKKVFPQCVLASDAIEKKLKKKNVLAFLTPSIHEKTDLSTILACTRLDIKTCVIQHGAMGHLKLPVIKYTDYINVDYTYVYGSATADFFNKEFIIDSEKKMACPIPTGNPLLQRLYFEQRNKTKKSINSSIKNVLYIDTHFTHEFYYYGWNCYPSIWYSHLQQKMVDVFKKTPNVNFYMKLYPGENTPLNPLRNHVADNNITNVTFLDPNEKMSSSIDLADLFIIDFPTTSLLNCLCTNKPIIVYYNPQFLRMSETAQQLLQKRTMLCSDEEEFMKTIEDFCISDNWSDIKTPNDDFLINYGLNAKDIDAKKAVVNHLKSIRNTLI